VVGVKTQTYFNLFVLSDATFLQSFLQGFEIAYDFVERQFFVRVGGDPCGPRPPTPRTSDFAYGGFNQVLPINYPAFAKQCGIIRRLFFDTG